MYICFFLRPVHGLTRAKYYPQACLKQTGKPSRPGPFRVAFARAVSPKGAETENGVLN